MTDRPDGLRKEQYWKPLEHNHMYFVDAREVTDVLNHTLGRVLNIVEAIARDSSQRDAVRELVKDAMRQSHSEASNNWMCAKSIELSNGALDGGGTRLIVSPLAHMFFGPQMAG